jgi:hypothetical protein
MPNNTTTTVKKGRKFKVREKATPKFFKVTLKLSFRPHLGSSDDLEKGEHGYEDENNEEFCARVQDWIQTDTAYGTNAKIEAHVKKNNPMDFVEGLVPNEVVSAEWLDGFRISFITKTDPTSTHYQTAAEIKDWIEHSSLEDAEYESSGDNGWRIPTLKDIMEYGLTDYRDNPVIVEEVSGNATRGGRRRQTRRRR